MTTKIVKPRLNAFNKQSGRCYYCGSPMWLKNIEVFTAQYRISKSAAARFKCTAEHLTARCDGGGNNKNNIVAACLFCNNTRHKRKDPPDPPKYKAQIKKRLAQGKWHPKELHHVLTRSF